MATRARMVRSEKHEAKRNVTGNGIRPIEHVQSKIDALGFASSAFERSSLTFGNPAAIPGVELGVTRRHRIGIVRTAYDCYSPIHPIEVNPSNHSNQ